MSTKVMEKCYIPPKDALTMSEYSPSGEYQTLRGLFPRTLSALACEVAFQDAFRRDKAINAARFGDKPDFMNEQADTMDKLIALHQRRGTSLELDGLIGAGKNFYETYLIDQHLQLRLDDGPPQEYRTEPDLYEFENIQQGRIRKTIRELSRIARMDKRGGLSYLLKEPSRK